MYRAQPRGIIPHVGEVRPIGVTRQHPWYARLLADSVVTDLWPIELGRWVLVALAYAVTGRLGLLLPAVDSTITLIWPPTGIAVAALYRWGYRCWPGVALGAFLVNTANPAAGLIAIGNTVAPLVVVATLRWLGLQRRMPRRRDVGILAAAAAGGMLLSSTAGVGILSASGTLTANPWSAWLTWWGGDTMGVVSVAPLLLSFDREARGVIAQRWPEFVTWVIATSLTAWAVFVTNGGSSAVGWSLAFLPLPLVAWSAVRFGPSGTGLALLLVSAIAAYGTAAGQGPFFRHHPQEDVIVLWAFMATSAVLGVLTTALCAERSEHELHLRAVLALETECVKLVSPQGTLLEVNPAGLALLGAKSIEAVRGRPVGEFLAAEDLAAFAALHGQALAGVASQGEFGITTPSGDRRILEAHCVPCRSAQGVLLGVLSIARDVTERRLMDARSAAEREVLESMVAGAPLTDTISQLAKSYEKLFHDMRLSVLLLDADGRRLRHLAAPRLPLEFCKAIDGVAIGPSVGSCGTAAFERRLVIVTDIATDLLWRDYRDLALSHGLRACWSLPMYSSQNRVLGTFAAYYGEPRAPRPHEMAALERAAHFASLAIERSQLLQSLQAGEARLGSLVSHLPGMAYRCQNDAQWTMSYVSEGCEALTGYRRDELENNRSIAYGDLVHPQDRDGLWSRCQASLQARKPCHNEYCIIDRHGRERWVSEHAGGVYDDKGDLICIDGFVQDITLSRAAVREREAIQRKMQESQKLESLGVLAGGIAHDFNNILTTVVANASMISLDLPADSVARDYLAQIRIATARATELCRQMLAYSGKGRFVVQNVDLGRIIEDTLQMLRISIGSNVELRLDLAANLPPIAADATQLRQVIMNLVINGSEAVGETAPGVVTLTTSVERVVRDNSSQPTTICTQAGDYVRLEVSDTGSGMSGETQSRIFDPFFSTKFTGRGLGLAAVLGIVRGHRGSITVESVVGQGSRFKLLFPAVDGPVADVVEPPRSMAAWQGHGTVLVADDEGTIRAIVGSMLRALGFDAVVVSDGQEALDVFGAAPDRFAVVLLDLRMRSLDGEQTLAGLRRLRPDVRVVLMSGFDEHDTMARFAGKGLASFLQKPFEVDALSSVLQEVLDPSPG